MAKQNQFRQVQRSQQRPQSPPPAEVRQQPAPAPVPEPAPLPEPIEVPAKRFVEPISPLDEQGPDNVFDAIVNSKPTAIVFQCGDPRFQNALRQFVEGKKNLGLAQGEYIPIVVGGSASALARPWELPKDFKFMREQLELFRQHFHSIKRVIVIHHEDCARYKGLCQKLVGLLGPFHAHLPLVDMKQIAQVFAHSLSHLEMQLEMYYAKFVEGDPSKIVIDRVS